MSFDPTNRKTGSLFVLVTKRHKITSHRLSTQLPSTLHFQHPLRSAIREECGLLIRIRSTDAEKEPLVRGKMMQVFVFEFTGSETKMPKLGGNFFGLPRTHSCGLGFDAYPLAVARLATEEALLRRHRQLPRQ